MRLRRRLWQADPHCHWCGQVTIWFDEPKGRAPANAATLDHLYSQLDPRRKEPDGGTHVVLACWRCNHDRGEAENLTHAPNPPRQPSPGAAQHGHRIQPSPGTIGPKRRPFQII